MFMHTSEPGLCASVNGRASALGITKSTASQTPTAPATALDTGAAAAAAAVLVPVLLLPVHDDDASL
jgi:hypothetical protein